MAKVNLFLMLPETEPTNQWIRSTEKDFYGIHMYERLIQELLILFDSITIEKYEGFYDSMNINNFILLYNTLEDCYPSAPKKLLRSIILKNAFSDWRKEAIQSFDVDYLIFNQPISNDTFCEIAERKYRVEDDNHALINHHACRIKKNIAVKINRRLTKIIDNLRDKEEIIKWFSQNRLPPRKFHVNQKHGENRQETRNVNGKKISPLRCSCQKAQALLDTAIGKSEKELYNIDLDHDEIIVFKFEGTTPQNMYHGYHVPKNAEEVPVDIRKRFI